MLHPRNRIDAHLENAGSETATGDYLATPTRFTWTPLTSRNAHIYRLIVSVQDSGSFDASKYGNNLTLVNGITVTVRNVADDSQVHNYTAGRILTNADWAAHCFDADVKTWGLGDEILVARWTFDRAGSPIALNDSLYLSVDLHDTFTGLTAHTFVIQGEYV